MSKHKEHKECKGCKSYYGLAIVDGVKRYPRFCIVPEAKISQCPCKTCIIKSMCNHPCEKFKNFAHRS